MLSISPEQQEQRLYIKTIVQAIGQVNSYYVLHACVQECHQL